MAVAKDSDQSGYFLVSAKRMFLFLNNINKQMLVHITHANTKLEYFGGCGLREINLNYYTLHFVNIK